MAAETQEDQGLDAPSSGAELAQELAADTTAFDNMEVAAAAAGPEAEARRQEMGTYSELAGAYADSAATKSTEAEQNSVQAGDSPEEVAQHSRSLNDYMAGGINPINPDRKFVVKPTEAGMTKVDAQGEQTYRSPAEIAKDTQPPKPKKRFWFF